MKVFGVSGGSPDARRALIEALIPHLIARRLKVSVAIEAPSDFDLDRPRKDSYEHRQAGAAEVMISSAKRWALMHECDRVRAPDLDALMTRMIAAELLLVDGFEDHPHKRLQIREPQGETGPAEGHDPRVVGLVRSGLPAAAGGGNSGQLPVFESGETDAIAEFIVACCGL